MKKTTVVIMSHESTCWINVILDIGDDHLPLQLDTFFEAWTCTSLRETYGTWGRWPELVPGALSAGMMHHLLKIQGNSLNQPLKTIIESYKLLIPERHYNGIQDLSYKGTWILKGEKRAPALGFASVSLHITPGDFLQNCEAENSMTTKMIHIANSILGEFNCCMTSTCRGYALT
ncbi:U1 protein [Mundri virus]|uniref:U1 protein n=1 Tax=Mundri virus TaxID=2913478 RepID=UPI002481F45F|nr:U1 protein [Mundri virus]UJY53552.1 U1 protein [Mundri virus]